MGPLGIMARISFSGNIRAGPTVLPTAVVHAACGKAESEIKYRHD